MGGFRRLEDLLHDIVPVVSRLLGAERATLFMADANAGELWSLHAEGEGDREIRLQFGDGVAGHVAQHQTPLVVNNAYDDARFCNETDLATGFVTRNLAAVPVHDAAGHLVAVLEVLNKPTDFGDEDMALLAAIAVHTAYAVDNARQSDALLLANADLERAHARSELRRRELDLLLHIEQATAGALDTRGLLSAVLRAVCERLGARDAAALVLSDRKVYAATGERTCSQRAVEWVQRAAHTDATRDWNPCREEPLAAQEIGMPLIWHGSAIGYLVVSGQREEDQRVFALIGAHLARVLALQAERTRYNEQQHLAVLGQMLASVAHDLRGTMALVSGFSQLMRDASERKEREHYMRRVEAAVDDQLSMVNNLLAFARGEHDLRTAPVDLRAMAEELRTALERARPEGIDLRIDAEDAVVHMDPQRMRRVLINLAHNAVQAMGETGTLSITLSAAQFVVADTGPGIPEPLRARVFEPFVSGGSGTGLGLAIVRRFVADHRGDVMLHSEPGCTRFVIRLPLPSEPLRCDEALA
jgi:signal transduction histidine kinase